MSDAEGYAVRRVVTGHDPEGRSVFVSDERVAATEFPGGGVAFLWGRDSPPSYPDDGAQPAWTEAFPPTGGVRLSYSRLLPGCVEEYDRFVAGAVPGDPVPGMHRTSSLDLDVVVEGELTLELDDGAKVVLGPGDVVVQNGTRHRWSNEGTVPVVLAAICIGADNALVT